MAKHIDRANHARYQRQRAEWGAATGYYRRVAERDIARVITDTCDALKIPYMRNYPNKIVTDKQGQKILARIPEHQRGKPDFTVLGRDRVTLWIETKATDGKLSEDQKRWKQWIITYGHEYHAPRTVEEAHAVAARIVAVGR